MKNLTILGVHRKIRILEEGFMKNQYRGGECLKSWGLNSRCKEGGLGKTEVGDGFEGEGDTPMHSMMNLWDVH